MADYWAVKAREQAKLEREMLKEQWRREREALRAEERRQREAARLAEKDAKQRLLQASIDTAIERTMELRDRVTVLSTILEHTLKVDDRIQFDSLRIRDPYPAFKPPSNPGPRRQKPSEEFYMRIPAPGGFKRLFPGVRKQYENKLAKAKADYTQAMQRYNEEEKERAKKYQADVEAARLLYEEKKAGFFKKVQQRDLEVDALIASYMKGERETVITYNTMVLERSEYPDGCPQNFRLGYAPESKELIIEYELPLSKIIPTSTEVRYTKSRNAFEKKPRKPAEIKLLYQDVVAGIALRTLHEVFEADQGNHLAVVIFNGYVRTIDRSTGNDIEPVLVSVRTTKESFDQIRLDRVDKQTCLRNLGAQVSPQPTDLIAVKPIVEFNMIDKRFVEQDDMLTRLDARPNLMDLNPTEFEHLVSNLFQQMGLETKLTRSSRDGGVDAVAFDMRPVLGGKVVIQAKRYKNPVEVSAVRDLYGTMINEGANKGILVATSNYGPDAFEFVKDKPVELIDGGGLLYLLEQVGIHARIVLPTEG